MRTSNHEVDGRGCQYQQIFFDDQGQRHHDHVYATEFFSNRSMRPVHDFVMASEYVELTRIHRALRELPPRYLVALKTDCLVYQKLPRKLVHTVEALTRRRQRDKTPKITSRRSSGGRVPGATARDGAADGAGTRRSLLLSGMPGTGKTHLASQIASQLSQLGEGVDALQRAELWFGGADGGPMGAQDHPRGALLVEEVTQLNGPTSPSSPRTAESGFCCSGTFDSARAHGKPAQPREDLSPPAIPQVDEAEQVAGLLDTCLSYSHQRPGEPAGRAGGRCCWSTGQAGSRRTNKPQTMRFWLGLSLVTTSGRVRKGCCVTVREAGERIVLDDRQCFTPAELLRSTRFCHAITYASCQGLTLRGRVWLLQRISTSGIARDETGDLP